MSRLSMLPAAILAILVLLAPAARAANPFDVGSKVADSAIVTTSEDLPQDIGPTSPMLDQLRGIIARLNKPQLLELRASGIGPLVEPPVGSTRLCVIHLTQIANIKHVEVLRDPAGVYFAQELLQDGVTTAGTPKARATKLSQSKFSKIAAAWPAYRAGFALYKGSPRPGDVAEIPRPYTPGWFTIDQEVMGERFNGGQHTGLEAPARDLSTEPLLIRLPKDYDPKIAYGVIVYIDPGEKGSIYQPFHAAADQMGFILVAAVNTGNSVHRAIRYQLAFDGLATVSERYLTDPRRTYVTGISGGGQITTHLWLCFPDVFTGAVPIVALGSYENIPAGPGKMWQATFSKPIPKLFRMAIPHRCAVMTGAQDFNEAIIGDAAKLLVRDGLNVHVYDYPDMGHQAPTTAHFTDALTWVDEPYQRMRDKEVKAAEAALTRVTADPALSADARKAALVEVTRLGAWTPAAWKAADLLGVKPPSP